jgi:hypothetical protein
MRGDFITCLATSSGVDWEKAMFGSVFAHVAAPRSGTAKKFCMVERGIDRVKIT